MCGMRLSIKVTSSLWLRALLTLSDAWASLPLEKYIHARPANYALDHGRPVPA